MISKGCQTDMSFGDPYYKYCIKRRKLYYCDKCDKHFDTSAISHQRYHKNEIKRLKTGLSIPMDMNKKGRKPIDYESDKEGLVIEVPQKELTLDWPSFP